MNHNNQLELFANTMHTKNDWICIFTIFYSYQPTAVTSGIQYPNTLDYWSHLWSSSNPPGYMSVLLTDSRVEG